jgi:predicted ATPase/class 3 adenylate cyclase
VTFVFTDVAESTRLLQELGSGRYAAVMDAHRRLVRGAFEEAGGVEVDMQGDAFFFAFTSAGDALAGCVAAQRALAVHQWPGGESMSVRMGVHTGRPLLTGEGYVGIDVHRGARIGAAAHGGQVVASQAVLDAVGGSAVGELGLRELGEHRLKDLTDSVRLYQLLAAGLETEFPALRTLTLRTTNLPVQPSRLIGRERELSAAMTLLRLPDVPVLTITGPAGVGKTRFALELAAAMLEEQQHGAFYVALSPVRDPLLVIDVVARTLGLRAAGEEPIGETLIRYVRDRELVLVLDNLEHLLDSAVDVARVLAAAPRVTAIVTSRAPLRIAGERELALEPLATSDASTLFFERMQAIRPEVELSEERIEAVHRLCAGLDNLPLAIELAASRTRVLQPEALLQRMHAPLDLLVGGRRDAPDRHRTLRDAIGWSYGLLDANEKKFYAALGVFAGGFTAEAAEAVSQKDPLPGLETLLESSLLRRRDDASGPRYFLLETIREHAAEQLAAAGDEAAHHRRHAEHVLIFAAESTPLLTTSHAPPLFARLAVEQGNIRAALDWAGSAREYDLELALVNALATYWFLDGHLAEGQSRLEHALSGGGAAADPALREHALREAAYFAIRRGDFRAAADYAELAFELAGRLDDALALPRTSITQGLVAMYTGDLGTAVALFAQATDRFREAGAKADLGSALNRLGLAEMIAGRYQQSGELLAESANLLLEVGDESTAALVRCNQALALQKSASATDRLPFLREAIDLARCTGNRDALIWALAGAGGAAAERGDAETAARLLGASEAIRQRSGQAIVPFFKAEHQRAIEQARQSLPKERFAAAWADGESLSEAAESLV